MTEGRTQPLVSEPVIGIRHCCNWQPSDQYWFSWSIAIFMALRGLFLFFVFIVFAFSCRLIFSNLVYSFNSH